MNNKKERPRKYTKGVETEAVLLEFALVEYARSGPLDFNMDVVLAESGVSRGSLYHHYQDRATLIVRCESVLLKQSMKEENEVLRLLTMSGISGTDLFELLAIRIRANSDEAQLVRRQQRVQSLAVTFHNDSMREIISAEQQRGTTYFHETLIEAKGLGLIDPIIDLEGLSMVIQALFLGRIVFDISGESEQLAKMDDATIEILRLMMRPQPS